MDISFVTIIIIAANVLLSFKGFKDRSFFERYKFQIGPIKAGEKDRIMTSGFLHVDEMHLIFNMITLYFFSGVVIYQFGQPLFLLIYLVSLAAGNLLAVYFHRNEYYYSAVGASGAVMGVLYASILLNPYMKINFIPGYLFGLGYLAYTIYGMKTRHDNIGHTAHFGGAIGGYILTLVLQPSLFITELHMVVLLAIPILVFFYLVKTGKL